MINRAPSLTEQVRSHLKRLIVEGGFAEGRIPSETELAAELGVSRTTVRDALSRLEHEGSIVRRQGAGTFVNPPGLRVKTRLEEMWSYEQMLRDHGYTPSVKGIAVSVEPAGDDTVAALELEPGSRVIAMEKVFYENGDPVALTYNYVPADLVTDPVTDSDAITPIFDFLEDRAGKQLAYYVSDIVPITLTGEWASLLDVGEGTPAISFDETGFSAEAEPLVHARSTFRDDLLRLAVMRRKTGG